MTQALLEKPSSIDNDRDHTKEVNISLLMAVLEGLSDGVLILNTNGKVIHANRCGQQLCRQIGAFERGQSVPQQIWTICEYLVESREHFSEERLVITQDINTDKGPVQVRVQWFQFDIQAGSYLLVTLEDRAQASRLGALFESRQYNLTERETEVWALKKADHSYEEIASQLFISTNTVKRHLKSIFAKRKQVLELEEA